MYKPSNLNERLTAVTIAIMLRVNYSHRKNRKFASLLGHGKPSVINKATLGLNSSL